MSKTELALLAVLVFVVIRCENKEIIMDNGLIIEDLIIGVGTTAEKYSIVTVHYTGKLQDGTVFDSSQRIGQEPLKSPRYKKHEIPYCLSQKSSIHLSWNLF